MIKKIVLAAAALIMLLGAASVFSPHWTVHRMRSAIHARDLAAFSAHVDFPALRESFRSQLAGDFASRDGSAAGSPLDALGRGLMGALAGPVIEVLVRPAGLAEMLNSGTPAVTREVIAGTITQVPAAAAAPDMTLAYRDLDTVVYRRRDLAPGDGSFLLKRHGWWSWRLAAVELAGTTAN